MDQLEEIDLSMKNQTKGIDMVGLQRLTNGEEVDRWKKVME